MTPTTGVALISDLVLTGANDRATLTASVIGIGGTVTLMTNPTNCTIRATGLAIQGRSTIKK